MRADLVGPQQSVPATIVLAGPTCSGKTTLARRLAPELGWPVVAARHAIQLAGDVAVGERHELVRVGMQLERHNPGRWLADATDATVGPGNPAIVDAARTWEQVVRLRERHPPAVVIHVTADRVTRERRFDAARDGDETLTFGALAATAAEVEADDVIDLADLRIDTSEMTEREVVDKVLRWLTERTQQG